MGLPGIEGKGEIADKKWHWRMMGNRGIGTNKLLLMMSGISHKIVAVPIIAGKGEGHGWKVGSDNDFVRILIRPLSREIGNWFCDFSIKPEVGIETSKETSKNFK